jgi:hypothetical protein
MYIDDAALKCPEYIFGHQPEKSGQHEVSRTDFVELVENGSVRQRISVENMGEHIQFPASLKDVSGRIVAEDPHYFYIGVAVEVADDLLGVRSAPRSEDDQTVRRHGG